jgi:hypothetical protein
MRCHCKRANAFKIDLRRKLKSVLLPQPLREKTALKFVFPFRVRGEKEKFQIRWPYHCNQVMGDIALNSKRVDIFGMTIFLYQTLVILINRLLPLTFGC